jgi:hypothetical protein
MAENKTKPTEIKVDDFLDGVPDPERRADGKKLRDKMEAISGYPATMWGPSIVGFGRCRYQHESGRSGEMPRIGFSPRAKELVLYLSDDYSRHQPLMDRLGKHRTGKSCLYIKRLADVDEGVLDDLIRETFESVNRRYPEP